MLSRHICTTACKTESIEIGGFYLKCRGWVCHVISILARQCVPANYPVVGREFQDLVLDKRITIVVIHHSCHSYDEIKLD